MIKTRAPRVVLATLFPKQNIFLLHILQKGVSLCTTPSLLSPSFDSDVILKEINLIWGEYMIADRRHRQKLHISLNEMEQDRISELSNAQLHRE